LRSLPAVTFKGVKYSAPSAELVLDEKIMNLSKAAGELSVLAFAENPSSVGYEFIHLISLTMSRVKPCRVKPWRPRQLLCSGSWNNARLVDIGVAAVFTSTAVMLLLTSLAFADKNDERGVHRQKIRSRSCGTTS
jgi:hypothetical protein